MSRPKRSFSNSIESYNVNRLVKKAFETAKNEKIDNMLAKAPKSTRIAALLVSNTNNFENASKAEDSVGSDLSSYGYPSETIKYRRIYYGDQIYVDEATIDGNEATLLATPPLQSDSKSLELRERQQRVTTLRRLANGSFQGLFGYDQILDTPDIDDFCVRVFESEKHLLREDVMIMNFMAGFKRIKQRDRDQKLFVQERCSLLLQQAVTLIVEFARANKDSMGALFAIIEPKYKHKKFGEILHPLIPEFCETYQVELKQKDSTIFAFLAGLCRGYRYHLYLNSPASMNNHPLF